MKKYIRTKDGVYEIERYYEPRDYYWVKQDCEQPIGSDEIIKQADTIEELCDEFVLKAIFDGNAEYQNNKKLYLLKLSKIAYDSERKYLTKIYGATWTDIGLIYVAKMNEEGELELL